MNRDRSRALDHQLGMVQMKRRSMLGFTSYPSTAVYLRLLWSAESVRQPLKHSCVELRLRGVVSWRCALRGTPLQCIAVNFSYLAPLNSDFLTSQAIALRRQPFGTQCKWSYR